MIMLLLLNIASRRNVSSFLIKHTTRQSYHFSKPCCHNAAIQLRLTTSSSNEGIISSPKTILDAAIASNTINATESKQVVYAPRPIQLVDIGSIQSTVVNALNELYDPKQVAQGKAKQQIAKQQQLGEKKRKKKASDAVVPLESNNNNNNYSNNGHDNNESDITMTLEQQEAFIEKAMQEAPTQFSISDAAVTTATRAEFGDYQINAALQLASALGESPRATAERLLDHLSLDEIFTAELAGPGFINLRYTDDYLTQAVRVMCHDAHGRLAVPRTREPLKVVVDYSSPNIAKEMHVGHLRSTIIGHTLANLLEFSGHNVVRLNHVGDWGTQFGMLVEHMCDEFPTALMPNGDTIELGDLVTLYKAAKKRFDAEPSFAERARRTVVALQAGDEKALKAWKTLCAASQVEYQKIYEILGITGLQQRGESFYNPYLAGVISELENQGLAVLSDGATVVFVEGQTNRDGSPLPMLVQKSDGGYNYATTDLAAVRHRTLLPEGEQAKRVLYVTDAGQALHFSMVFDVAARAGFCPEGTSLEHVPFGLVQGEDGKKFATRSGETVKLKDLLDESIRIASNDLRERYKDNTDTEFLERVDRVARIVGIGAVKYADLSMNRESNYRFSYERMLSLNGNTAPYMLYAYARICGIVRKASNQEDATIAVEWPPTADKMMISHESERELMRILIKLPDVIHEVERHLYPSRLCDYLFEISQKFNQFYENCSVMNAESSELKASRLSLCTTTAGTIRLLMTLLGIEVVEKL